MIIGYPWMSIFVGAVTPRQKTAFASVALKAAANDVTARQLKRSLRIICVLINALKRTPLIAYRRTSLSDRTNLLTTAVGSSTASIASALLVPQLGGIVAPRPKRRSLIARYAWSGVVLMSANPHD